jgi:hypothetical protein
MKRLKWQVQLGIALLLASIILYSIHYLLFRDLHHIEIYTLGDIAFVPIEVLLVTLIIHRLLNEREKRMRLQKLNMVIGVFFSEIGTRLLTFLSDHDPNLDDIRKNLIVTDDWSEEEFTRVHGRLRNYDYGVEIRRVDLKGLSAILLEKREFLVRLLENPTLLEHESFTELLQAVFHLTEELEKRDDLKCIPDTDCQHIEVDVKRVYVHLVNEWLDYMHHLKDNYPHLFSLAMRTNPLDQTASPIVK